MEKLYICNRADKDKCGICKHLKPHEYYSLNILGSCEKDLCCRRDIIVECVPIFEDFIEEKEMEI